MHFNLGHQVVDFLCVSQPRLRGGSDIDVAVNADGLVAADKFIAVFADFKMRRMNRFRCVVYVFLNNPFPGDWLRLQRHAFN